MILDLGFRHATPEDLNFVRNSWFESYRKGGCAPEVGFDVYKPGMERTISRLLERSDTRVAFAREVPDEIVGWVCQEIVGRDVQTDVAHYVYVKQAYRRNGAATRLLTTSKLYFTHETRGGRHLASRLGLKFNPYLLNP